jgi:nuclear cap-binding protein subunit 1
VRAGLLNEDKREFVGSLVELAGARFDAALAAADRHAARLLLRFLAALVPANVLHASSVSAALTSLVEAATAAADAGAQVTLPCYGWEHSPCMRHWAGSLQRA